MGRFWQVPLLAQLSKHIHHHGKHSARGLAVNSLAMPLKQKQQISKQGLLWRSPVCGRILSSRHQRNVNPPGVHFQMMQQPIDLGPKLSQVARAASVRVLGASAGSGSGSWSTASN